MTPHAPKKFEQHRKVKSYAKQRWYAKKKLKMHDTACTFDKRFERPWQPLKGISIKNIYVPELSYPTTKKIYKFKGATYLTKNVCAFGVNGTACTIFSRRIRSRIQKGFSP
jgi:hypothetical protein